MKLTFPSVFLFFLYLFLSTFFFLFDGFLCDIFYLFYVCLNIYTSFNFYNLCDQKFETSLVRT